MEGRTRGEIGWRTRAGEAHREAAAVAMAAQLAVRSGRGVDAGAYEQSTARGGTV
jgi:alkylhydroperoxidase family enzyme